MPPGKIESPSLKKYLGDSVPDTQARSSLVAVHVIFGFEGNIAVEVDNFAIFVNGLGLAVHWWSNPFGRSLLVFGNEFVCEIVLFDELGIVFLAHVIKDFL